MGLFKKLKNFITGGAAKVSVLFEESTSNGVDPVRCFIVADAEQDCSISEVYVEFKAEERYLEIQQETDTDDDGNTTNRSEEVTRYESVHFEKKIAATNIQIKDNASGKWLVTFDFPQEVIPTYHGKNAHLKWLMRAGLDMKGIDPKSSWVELIVEKEMIF